MLPAAVADAIDLSRVRRALVIKLRHHGDVLLTSKVFTVLQRAAPQAEIDALVYRETMPMLAGHPAISELHGIDRDAQASRHPARRSTAEWRLLPRAARPALRPRRPPHRAPARRVAQAVSGPPPGVAPQRERAGLLWRGIDGPACGLGCGSALASPAFRRPTLAGERLLGARCLVNTDQADLQPACREWGLRPRVATTALQRACAVWRNEHLGMRRWWSVDRWQSVVNPPWT